MINHQLLVQAVKVPGNYQVNDQANFVFSGKTIAEVVDKGLKYGFVLAGIVLFIFISKAGFSLMTSGGDPKKIEQAKSDLTSSLIGFFIVFGSFWIFVIVKYIFGIT